MEGSIVIPTLNEADCIADCLDSVTRNLERLDDVDLEVVIVDSHSTDDTVGIVRSHPIDCRIVDAENGILTARHAGIEAADGEIIVSLDADTVYGDRYLSALLTPFRERSDVALTYGPCYGEYPHHIDAVLRLGLQYGLPFAGLDWVSGANRAFVRSAYYAVGGYDRSIDSRSVFRVMAEEQVAFPLRLRSEGEIVFVDAATARQSARTLEQLFLLGRKNGGQEWSILHHYRFLERLKNVARKLADPRLSVVGASGSTAAARHRVADGPGSSPDETAERSPSADEQNGPESDVDRAVHE